jgi:hypothetical protein
MKPRITSSTTVEDIAAIVSEALNAAGIEAVLSGGSVVSIYANNEYVSHDLDFVTAEGVKEIEPIMVELGFERKFGRHFIHPHSEFYVEFPSAPLAIGNEPVKSWAKRRTKAGIIHSHPYSMRDGPPRWLLLLERSPKLRPSSHGRGPPANRFQENQGMVKARGIH